MTKHHPVYEVNKIIKGYAVKYSKSSCRVHSLWYFDCDSTLLTICTDKPGIWVGKAGKDVAQLTEDVNKVIVERNERLQKAYKEGRLTFKPDIVPQLAVSLIECNF